MTLQSTSSSFLFFFFPSLTDPFLPLHPPSRPSDTSPLSRCLPYTSRRPFLTCRLCRVASSPRLVVTCHIVVLTRRPRYPLCRAMPFVRSTRGACWFVLYSFFIFYLLTPFLSHASHPARSFATRRLCRVSPRHASVTRCHLATRPPRAATSSRVRHAPPPRHALPSSRVVLRLVARRLSRCLDVAVLGLDYGEWIR